MRGRWLWALLLTLALGVMSTGTAHAQAEPKVLVLSGGNDAANQAAVTTIKQLGDANDFTVEEAAGVADINSTKLNGYQSLVFVNVAGDVLDAAGESALQDYVSAGNGFLGIGSTATVEPGSSFVNGLIGARPSNSPTAVEARTVVAGDRVHPATRDLPLQFDRSDLWYTWTTRPTGSVHTVARYRAVGAAAGDGTNVGGTDNPIAWCRDYSNGRSFYLGMGRTEASWGEENLKKLTLGALEWTTGLVRGDCKATINSNYKGTKLMSIGATTAGTATSGESHGMSIADNGWVLYIGRGDCRTDTDRGALLGLSSLARILDHSNQNVGIGCGTVHIFDPTKYTGQENSGVTKAGTLAVYGDGGTGGERTNESNHKMEYGLLGIAVDPKFSQNGYVYLQYFPTFNENTKPKGLPIERRISKMSQPRISRFTIDRATKQLDLDSERILFQYDAQIFSCCHVGGGMGFDQEGNLYVTTGDTNSSQNQAGANGVDTGPLGYGGNNPLAKCPVGPATEASSAHCGTANYSYQDARRTAGNTNDYNGKMLRFNPLEDIPAGTEPGVGKTYSLPTTESPNGPNLFDGKEGGGGKTKPEIYAMGLRNPSRLSIDPKTGTPYSAWVGPDAQNPNAAWGPSTYENAAQLTRAGNYGWPYCMGNKQAYRDRVDTGAARTTNGPGYVSGGPATGGTDGWYDCDNLRNDSPNNTGLVELPHETGTGADAGKVRGNNVWFSRGNPSNSNGCPDFPRPRGANAAPNYGATTAQGLTQKCPYITSNGLTIMNGPVYRYTEGAADNSRRWPAYWDGRWFLHDYGNTSVKHGLLLDPATSGQGGQPIWADSLRNTLSWGGSYFDSKFGPDGALYVQTYDGFFRANANVGLYRYDYTGGAPTPGASPKASAIGANRARFSSTGSGGVKFQWSFGDGKGTSTDANPTYTYDAPGRYTATLTVEYADGAKDSKTVVVDVISAADSVKPVTTAALSPTPPVGNIYTRPVTVTLTATDPAPSGGLDRTEYRINGGTWNTYSAPIRRQQPGLYLVEYRSVDQAGNEEDIKSVTFEIKIAENCLDNLNDEFNGTSLDPKWTVLRGDAAQRSFENGALRVKVRAGDMYGAQATAKNVLVQDAPSGPWQIQTKLDVSTLTLEGEQAGFILWQGENPNNFTKITYISKGTYSQYEWVATRAGTADIHTGSQISTPDGDVYLRVTSNGSGTYVAEGSTNGETWQPIADPITNIGNPETLKVGLKVSDGQDSENYAAFDHFRVNCSDFLPPSSKAEIKGGELGELGWYTSAPRVELTADDGEFGDGVDKIQYRVDNGDTRTYEGAISVDTPGEHVIEYWSTDKAENVEAVKRIAYRIDTAAPAIEPTTEGDGESGPVTVTLDTPDGDKGSGVVLTEYRVDGGPWTTYAATDEDILLDGSQSSLAAWRQVGAGGFELMSDGSGGITPTPSSALGMLYFPHRDYGDFKMKFQFREGRTDGQASNGGAFVRFPNPEETPRRHECSKVGSAATQPAWVAIYCGFEIQLFDEEGNNRESRKTGSIYTFDNNGPSQIGVPRAPGTWEDYEIEVVGQHYTIRRNGQVINEWDNNPGINADRGPDPNTSLRQFARGYIGLQNHGGADTMQYRNVRVEDLTPGKPKAKDATGAFEVEGLGNHTIEVRTTDAAGNHARETFDLEIGETVSPDTGTPTVQAAPLQPTSNILPPLIDTPATYRLGSITSKVTRATFNKRGVKIPVACTGAMTGSAKITVSSADRKRLKLSSATIDSEDVTCWGPHTATVTLKPSSAIAKALARKGGPKSVKLTVSVQMRDWGKPATTTTKTITLRR